MGSFRHQMNYSISKIAHFRTHIYAHTKTAIDAERNQWRLYKQL